MKTDKLGLYVHIPFCQKKCNYCDFCSFSGLSEHDRKAYIDELCKEILSYEDKRPEIDTIFFGGGTPTLLSVDDMAKIVDAIKRAFLISDDVEFTMESNPGTTCLDNLKGYIECGVNRFSIGLQSIHENELKKLGRIHSYNDFLITYNDLRSLGIGNINVDLMYGIPEQTIESFDSTLQAVTALGPEHLSVYGLILEEGTPFYESAECLGLPTEDKECDMYYHATEFLRSKGYSHYEISNYSRDGKSSRHNLKYWHSNEFIGVGLSAYSYFENKRYGNTKSYRDYLSGTGRGEYCEVIDQKEEMYEYAMLRLRLGEGISLSEYSDLFLVDFRLGREAIIEQLAESEYLICENDRIALTEKGFYVSNYIINELL